ncbi:MAG TPA: hypothetical protein VH437_20540 [Terriglobales bacterium]
MKRMASGDLQRVWFEEMVEVLRSRWRREMLFEAMIRLRDDLDEMLQRIRRERQIPSSVTQCPECGHIGESAPPHVTMQAMILSVSRFAIDEPEATRAVEKAWKAHQKTNHLDVYGQAASANIHAKQTSMRGHAVRAYTGETEDVISQNLICLLQRQSSRCNMPGRSDSSDEA